MFLLDVVSILRGQLLWLCRCVPIGEKITGFHVFCLGSLFFSFLFFEMGRSGYFSVYESSLGSELDDAMQFMPTGWQAGFLKVRLFTILLLFLIHVCITNSEQPLLYHLLHFFFFLFYLLKKSFQKSYEEKILLPSNKF